MHSMMISSSVAAVQCPVSSDQTWKKAILGISPSVRRRLLIEVFTTPTQATWAAPPSCPGNAALNLESLKSNLTLW